MQIQIPSSSKNFLFTLSFFAIIVTSQSACSTTRILTRPDSNTIANSPLNRRTTWTYAWGLVQPKDINPHCEPSANYMTKVTVKTNLGFILLSAITLGAVIPQRVEWACSPPIIRPDTLGN